MGKRGKSYGDYCPNEKICGTCVHRKKCNRHSVCMKFGGKIIGCFDTCASWEGAVKANWKHMG